MSATYFRSVPMDLYHIYLKRDHVFSCFAALGHTGVVEFKDISRETDLANRLFSYQIILCVALESKINFLLEQMKINEIEIPAPIANIRIFSHGNLSSMEDDIVTLHTRYLEINKNSHQLMEDIAELYHSKEVLKEAQRYLDDKAILTSYADLFIFYSDESDSSSEDFELKTKPYYYTGIIWRDKVFSFEKVVNRITFGNVFFRSKDLNYPDYYDGVFSKRPRSSFFLLVVGSQFEEKVFKLIEGYNATVYACPQEQLTRQSLYRGVKHQLSELEELLENSKSIRNQMLDENSYELVNYAEEVKQLKATYCVINLCNLDPSKKSFMAECWIPRNEVHTVKEALSFGAGISGTPVEPILCRIETDEVHPTYNITNKFTQAFQNIVDAYGIAQYREMSPVPYTIISFPFLFAIMFGDMGHGMILAAFGTWMIIYEDKPSLKQSQNEIFSIFFSGRYMILLMGLFSVYTGFIYNDIFSVSINIFGSSWSCNEVTISEALTVIDLYPLDPATSDFSRPYPIGLDPVWQLSSNKILLHNSYKMKISIVIGVIHMMFGLCLSACNCINFNRKKLIIFEIIPQFLFISCLCGYMSFLILYKWVAYTSTNSISEFYRSETCAPSVLITFINMVLLKSTKFPEGCPSQIYAGQGFVQIVLLMLALVSVPWMLVAPIVYKLKTSKDKSNISEIVINQGIHTIEYVLGTISHTASYLRLWALSLAHAQLSEVLWARVFRKGFKVRSAYGSPILYIVFIFWAVLTFSVLVLMEGLSAFLHTLRLHWVEFQSKFYKGTGIAFRPFYNLGESIDLEKYMVLKKEETYV